MLINTGLVGEMGQWGFSVIVTRKAASLWDCKYRLTLAHCFRSRSLRACQPLAPVLRQSLQLKKLGIALQMYIQRKNRNTDNQKLITYHKGVRVILRQCQHIVRFPLPFAKKEG